MAVATGQELYLNFRLRALHRSAIYVSTEDDQNSIASLLKRQNTELQLPTEAYVSPIERYLCSIGTLNAGTTHNNVADHAVMTGTIRTFNTELSGFIFGRIEQIAQSLAAETGARITTHGPLKSVCVYNNPYLSELVMDSMRSVVGEENTVYFEMGMGSEDFSRYGEVVPAVFFRLGTGNAEKGICQTAHHDNFSIDESALIGGVKAMVQFVTDHQKGIDLEKARRSDQRSK